MTANNTKESTQEVVARVGLPTNVAEPILLTYRSVGIGLFGVAMRFAGMPLEKIALYMNSSQVSGKGQFGQAIKLVFRDGKLAPYRVVGVSSLTAWFLQYSIMGFAFQFFDHGLSQLMGVKPVVFGAELMEPPSPAAKEESVSTRTKTVMKNVLAPVLASSFESQVSNRAEVQRFFGPEKFSRIERSLQAGALRKAAGPAFLPSAMRNVIMCQTTFLLTPITYKYYFPQEHKSTSSLFWYGLGMNIFVGNVAAITQQALWGRSLDYLSQNGTISYRRVIQQGLRTEGVSAFFTTPKWFSRVLMNAPAQGVLPWFYNEVLPLGESALLTGVKTLVYEPFLVEKDIKTEINVEIPSNPTPATFTAHSPR